VLAGVSVDQAEQAIDLLRDAGIPVEVRLVLAGRLPGAWVHVAASDARKARELLAQRRFLIPMNIPEEASPDGQVAEGTPGDDVWDLLGQQDPPWPSVYSFP
jgi:hypothetical protein